MSGEANFDLLLEWSLKTVHGVLSYLAIILVRKRELVGLLFIVCCCCLFLTVPRLGLHSVIVTFPF